MTAAPPSDGVVAPPALAAFLRGIERRAAVLAELQSGSVERGAPALAAAMRAFRSHAATLPMADWPLHFWKLLAAVPSLRQIVTAARSGWPLPLAHLGKLTAADRLALLLRIVAGLDEPTAAQVLNQSTQDYQQALARACPRDVGGQPDAAGWRALADAAQQHLRELPPARLQALAQLRDAAIAAAPPTPALAPAAPAPVRPRRRSGGRGLTRARLAAAVSVVVVVVLLGTWWWGRMPSRPAAAGAGSGLALGAAGPVQVEELPAESETRSAPPLPAAAPAALPEPAVYDLDFFAWYAAGAPPARIERSAPSAEEAAEAAAAQPASGVATAPAQAAATDPPPALTPAQLRERQAAWEALGATVQARLRQVASAFAGLPVEQQHTLRAQFAALDALERHGWLLGPELGSEYWALQPLFGYVPDAQRAALLGLLRTLPAEQREHLALLAQRTPPQERATLRRELLAQGADTRAAWLRQRAAR
ncbi:hypothetical protein [Xanthomonas graminis]|uniref:Uncharacterized protein n=1 Tax=Xanthomonas graminis pv. graminis TaxID=134874 RepID=A0A1M4INU4_9XANT|nr:hypothetical protein [Xanthomonas translucens]OAX62510.1 hypothetical protein A6R72_09265 [Xanthomonas translucens pv. graminis]SBV43810.1 hypothetical protein XTGART2_2949 [Xanthomonas translucens pv. graminis]SBV44791.1 hypothetical protein XTGART9_2945 [Xanthomonas translucens pv. graminis]SBV48330.1 hypothetical protein XTGART29_2994 [Xanthomonas translucens pv. graminis ART-Xtg29]SBV56301.1 hypothetical protein XTGART10_2962 [Xanthomonas translucens pv. graminis]